MALFGCLCRGGLTYFTNLCQKQRFSCFLQNCYSNNLSIQLLFICVFHVNFEEASRCLNQSYITVKYDVFYMQRPVGGSQKNPQRKRKRTFVTESSFSLVVGQHLYLYSKKDSTSVFFKKFCKIFYIIGSFRTFLGHYFCIK